MEATESDAGPVRGTVGNEAFLRNIFAQGPFQGHGFVCLPSGGVSIAAHPDYDYTISDKPAANWVPWVVDEYRRQSVFSEAVGDDHVPCARLGTSTHIYAAAFGCRVHRSPDSNACAVPLVRAAAEADALVMPDIWNSPTLYRVFELAEAVQSELGKDVFLGPPDVQSGFDTACLVWNKEDMWCAMSDEAEQGAVKRLIDKCARLLETFLTEFRKAFPMCNPCHCPSVWAPPEMAPWLSNDECGMLSPAMFEEFCLPELISLGETFGGLGMHCCADAEHQFEAFKRIPGFYAFNRVAGRLGYGPLLEHFGDAPGPVHVLAWLSDEDIEYLVTHAPAGVRFIFQLSELTLDQAKAWLAKMRALSPRPG